MTGSPRPRSQSVAYRHLSRAGSPPARGGMILLVVLVTVALLALGALTFAELMLAEREGTEIYGRLSQARAAAASGAEVARLLISLDPDQQIENGGWYDNPTWFAGVPVLEETDPRNTAYFSVLAPADDGYATGSGVRYGLENESGKLNLNSLLLADQYVENGGRQLLMGLPGMTEDVADAIMDWIDADDEPREFGAEVDYYSSLSPAYAPKNGPLETVEELLLVRGVTPDLLFGADRNRNGLVDPGETVPDTLSALGVNDATAYRGWAAYLTLFSMELNVRPDGSPKIDINQDDLEALYGELEADFGPEAATFIVGYRQNGPYDGTEESQPPGEGALPDFSRPSRATFGTVLDLIDARVRMQFQGREEPVVLGPL
ncbi:MAG: general secretion pathway protein GspK, partial [Thermogutta sp.]|nr:general secretion pathway protein GspK [Thermogutta sp.]